MQNVRTPRRTFLLAAAGIVVGGTVIALRAQAPATDTTLPAFEVASVKPNKSVSSNESAMPAPGGRFVATNATLRNLITMAYDIQWFRLVGGSSRLTDRFDIVAKMPEHADHGQLRLMLRTLLAERFNLKAHNETREQPIYALVLAKRDGGFGPELRRSAADCEAIRVARATSRPDLAPPPVDPLPCSSSMMFGRLTMRDMPLDILANTLSGMVGRVVFDRTALTGNFNLSLRYAPDGTDSAQSQDPSIFTALQEQLGLTLESTKGPVEVLVIDHVEQPTPD
jgi:uncharacterized protein (TIGR03435 family)